MLTHGCTQTRIHVCISTECNPLTAGCMSAHKWNVSICFIAIIKPCLTWLGMTSWKCRVLGIRTQTTAGATSFYDLFCSPEGSHSGDIYTHTYEKPSAWGKSPAVSPCQECGKEISICLHMSLTVQSSTLSVACFLVELRKGCAQS